jgi:hypothetical protein
MWWWIEIALVSLIVGTAVGYLVWYIRGVIRFGSSSSSSNCGSGSGGCPSCGPDKKKV